MPVPVQRDQERTREGLRTWLTARHPGARDVVVTELPGSSSSGSSHETVLVDTSWTEDGRAHTAALAVRLEPTSYTVFPNADVGAEYRIIEALAAHADAPVPPLVGLEADTGPLGVPFMVMERLSGDVPSDSPPYTMGGWLHDAAPADQERVWWSGLEAMAAVHLAEISALGVDFLAHPELGAPGAEQQFGWWSRYLDWACEGAEPPATLTDALRWLREHLPPSDAPVRLCWGDSRIGNQIFRNWTCVALLDWEMAAIADPEMDLAWFCYFDRVFSEGLGIPRLPGFPSMDDTVARYEELVGRPTRHQAWYGVFAGYRFSAILYRLGGLWEAYGQLPEGSGFATENFALQFLVRQLDEVGAPRTGVSGGRGP